MIVGGQTEARAQLSSTIINYHQLSSTIIDYHEPFDQGLRFYVRFVMCILYRVWIERSSHVNLYAMVNLNVAIFP